MDKKPNYILLLIKMACLVGMLSLIACSNQKNTSFSRFYHSVNTRYNVHFNADEAYKESMKNKKTKQEEDDNLSKLLHIYPQILDSTELKFKDSFTTTIDKTTKAIKLHSIKTRPRRDGGRHGDKKYQEWVNRNEFNPFLENTWMLLAKSEFEEGNYLRAITTFMYITKIYNQDKKIVSESKLWIARAYSEMGWKYEAENVLRKMEQNDEIHHQLLGMYSSIKANTHIRNQQYESAIPYLEEAIKKEKDGLQKRRNKYLLAQLYAQIGENEKAYQAFGQVRSFSTPYNYVVNTKLRQLEVSNMPQQKVISGLNKLTKGVRNEPYLDQVYTVLGNVYLHANDTIKAIENYGLAIEKSEKGGYDKALAQIKLGRLHFTRQEYIQAQPHYNGALPQLSKNDEYYTEVSLRSEVLDQLVVHAKVVHEQDSMLHLVHMPEAERLAFIQAHIKKIVKEEEKEKREAELAQLSAKQELQSEYSQWSDLIEQQAQQGNLHFGNDNQKGSDFYFYNKNAVEQGRVAFQRKWGKRPLEDNWRRQNKRTANPFGAFDEELMAEVDTLQLPTDSVMSEGRVGQSTDKYSVEYYLQQLPFTEAEKEASYKLIENGLFNMGLVYKNLLEDNKLAIKTFEEDLTRFPDTPNKEEIYYQLFLIYLRMADDAMMAHYRNLIINEFPDGQYTTPLSDPNYAWNFKYMTKMQEDLYQETYEAYLTGDVNKVRKNYEDIQTKFPFVSLMPKFAFLHALTYAQTKDARQLDKNLTQLIADYPQADVTPMASNILKNIKDGMILLSDGTPITSLDWTMAYASDSIFAGDSARVIEYRTDLEKPYVLLLLFKPKTVDRNELLYQVADYNFSNYVIQTYDLNFDESPAVSTLEITGFKDFKAIKSYLNKAFEPESLLAQMDEKITPLPISMNNYKEMYPRLGGEAYMTFYGDSLGAETPKLLAYWSGERQELLAEVDDYEPTSTAPSDTAVVAKQVEIKTGEEKLSFTELDELAAKQKKEQGNDKEINLEDVLSKEQVEAIGKISQKRDDVIDALQGIIDNPVDGLTNLFNRKTLKENLTKEEKEELKKLEQEEKERQKELSQQLKILEDSIKRIEQFKLDSVNQVEKAIQDSIQTAERMRQDQVKLERQERERKLKEQEQEKQRQQQQREEERKNQLREREERRKHLERERQDLQKQRERERQELIKQREDLRKEREREADRQRKLKETERLELLKQRERQRQERKQ